MLDIDTVTTVGGETIVVPLQYSRDEPLAKAYPAAALLDGPGWTCMKCGHRNRITAAMCIECE